MAKRRTNVFLLEFWEDPFILRALKAPQALFYAMLFTRWPEHSSGIIGVSIETMHAQFRPREFSIKDIEDTLAVLEAAGKVVYDADVLWIVNYLKRHSGDDGVGGRPDWLAPSVARDLADCHSRTIYEAFLHKYQYHPLVPAVPPPYRYGDGGPPTWFVLGGPEKKEPKRPPVTPEPAVVERIVPEVRAEVDRVWEAYVTTMDSTLSLTEKRRMKILSRLSDKIIDRTTKQRRAVTADDLIAVIKACRASAFHMGANEGGKRYNLPEEHLFRSQEQVEKWLQEVATNHRPAAAPAPTSPPPQEERPPMTDEERTTVEREAAEARAKTRALLAGVTEAMP